MQKGVLLAFVTGSLLIAAYVTYAPVRPERGSGFDPDKKPESAGVIADEGVSARGDGVSSETPSPNSQLIKDRSIRSSVPATSSSPLSRVQPPDFLPDPLEVKNRDEELMQEWQVVRREILTDSLGGNTDVDAIIASLDERNASYEAQQRKLFLDPLTGDNQILPRSWSELNTLNQSYRKDVIAMIGESAAEKLETERQRILQSYAIGPYTIPHDTF